MRYPLAIAAILLGLAATAAAQSGAKVTIPPHSQQSIAFPLANRCPSAETFKVSTQPETDWLRFEPATVDVRSGTSFVVRLTAISSNHAAGTYRTAVKVICASCAASNPPCFASATEFPVELTVANVAKPGEFEPIADAANPAADTRTAAGSRPVLYIPPDPPPPSGNRWIAAAGGGLLLVGAGVMIFAIRALTSGRKLRPLIGQTSAGELSAESERHQVRR
jgi:hypothetical protein